MLLQNIAVRHSGYVVADNAMEWFHPGFFLIAGRQLSRRPDKECEHLRNHLLSLSLVPLECRTKIDILVKKVLDLPPLLVNFWAEGTKPARKLADIMHRPHTWLCDRNGRVVNQIDYQI